MDAYCNSMASGMLSMVVVHHDVGFLVLMVLGAFIIIPPIGGVFLERNLPSAHL